MYFPIWRAVLFTKDIRRSWGENAPFLLGYSTQNSLNRITPQILHRLLLKDGQTTEKREIKSVESAKISKILKVRGHLG